MIIGGDDLTDHGSYTNGATVTGWHYIQVVLSQMLQPGVVTRPGNDGSIAALGCSLSTATAHDAGGAIHYAAEVGLGKTVTYYDGAAAIDGFFAALAAGTVNPAVIWIAGNGATNNEDSTEVAAFNCRHGGDLRLFLNSGGGVFSHGFGNYDWVTGVLPGIVEVVSTPTASACQAIGAHLTAAGVAAYPGLSNGDFDATAGPCHSHFEGTFGPLAVLAVDGGGKAMILGANTTIPALTGFQITPGGTCCGYRFTTLATGFESVNNIGPLGILPTSDGYLVTDESGGRLLKFSGHVDGQSRTSAGVLASNGDGNALGLAWLGPNPIMTQQSLGKVVAIDPATGGISRDVATVNHATGVALFPSVPSHPRNGHLLVSQAGGTPNSIYDVNPLLPPASAATIFNADPADGLCITSDGSKLLAADGTKMNVYDTVNGSLLASSPFVCDSTDGIALGDGNLLGKAYANCNNGEVWEWKFDPAATDSCPSDAPAGPLRKIATGGTRGDFIAVDRYVPSKPGGSYPSLLLTQTDRILRLGYSDSPPAVAQVATSQARSIAPLDDDPVPVVVDGGWFGPPDPASGLRLNPASVPTLSAWGQIILGLAVLTASAILLGRRRDSRGEHSPLTCAIDGPISIAMSSSRDAEHRSPRGVRG